MTGKECIPVLPSSLRGDKAVAAGGRNEVSGEPRAEGQCPEVSGITTTWGREVLWHLLGRDWRCCLVFLHQTREISDQIPLRIKATGTNQIKILPPK